MCQTIRRVPVWPVAWSIFSSTSCLTHHIRLTGPVQGIKSTFEWGNRGRTSRSLGRKTDKELPALRILTRRISMEDIFNEVELAFGENPVLKRNLKMYSCQRYTGEKLKTIGNQISNRDRFSAALRLRPKTACYCGFALLKQFACGYWDSHIKSVVSLFGNVR